MAKKSKIARNEPRGSDFRSVPATRRPFACADVTPSTAVPEVSSRNSASRVSDSVKWHTVGNCQA